MSQVRQQILVLYLSESSLDSGTVAWSKYDGATSKGDPQMESGDSDTPPYASVLDAMRDGWFVIQISPMPVYQSGYEHELGYLPYEFVLERKVTIHE